LPIPNQFCSIQGQPFNPIVAVIVVVGVAIAIATTSLITVAPAARSKKPAALVAAAHRPITLLRLFRKNDLGSIYSFRK